MEYWLIHCEHRTNKQLSSSLCAYQKQTWSGTCVCMPLCHSVWGVSLSAAKGKSENLIHDVTNLPSCVIATSPDRHFEGEVGGFPWSSLSKSPWNILFHVNISSSKVCEPITFSKFFTTEIERK
jgi:hypothetical protein